MLLKNKLRTNKGLPEENSLRNLNYLIFMMIMVVLM
ncbi:Uncharacterised protein [Enterobacter hormaechei]|nr:Uncharacterised protein [Enterobacter hormaechei]SAD52914.1 Uncharacterised protein [Enterobacter hormaechei]SAD92359.1 Uncharacterised protein [Enterobacter hormaechei]